MKQLNENDDLVRTKRLSIGGMTCGGSVRQVTKALEGVTGVLNVDVDLLQNEATVKHLTDSVDQGTLVTAVQDAGYQASLGERGTKAAEVVTQSAAPGCSTGCCCAH